jgi:manganese/zinc/iron transport system permease protein
MSVAVSFPTGPMIVVAGAFFFLFSALFSPEKGLFFRILRRSFFHMRCQQENLLKVLWKLNVAKKPSSALSQHVQLGKCKELFLLWTLQKKGYCVKTSTGYELTPSGMLWGRKMVRLHRLWEVYLVEYCGQDKERVHPSAEELEHIITPEIEKELEIILNYPKRDPHKQPIPREAS